MQTITLYKVTEQSGIVTVGPVEPAQGTEYETLARLIADEGKALTDGEETAEVVDTYTPEAWTEINIDTDDEITDAEALEIIRGGTE